MVNRKGYIEKKLSALIEIAYEKAPAFKKRMDAARIKPSSIRNVKDLENLPILRKEDLIALQAKYPPYGGYLTVPIKNIEKAFVSPGPVNVPYIFSGYYNNHVKVMKGLGFRKGDLMLNTFSYQFFASHIVDDSIRAIGVTVVPTGVGNTELQVQTLRTLKITTFSGTASFLMNIIKRAEEMGYNFKNDFSLRLAVVGGEKLATSMRNTLEKDYGIALRENYATSDLGPVGFDCSAHNGMHILDEMLIMEIVDPNTGKQLGPGEIGEIVITPLNEAFPLIRYGTGDLSSYDDTPCVCRNKSARLVEILGRVGESVKAKGIFLHSKQVKEVIARFPKLTCVQIVVERPQHMDRVACLIEEGTQNVDKGKLSKEFGNIFQEICRLKLDQVQWVEKGSIKENQKVIVDRRVWK